jgi:hypothetical protein
MRAPGELVGTIKRSSSDALLRYIIIIPFTQTDW